MRRMELKRMDFKVKSGFKSRPFKLCNQCGIPMNVSSTRQELRYWKCPNCGDTGKQVRES